MTWNVATPADNSQVRAGDNYIRELKADLELAISGEHSFPVDGGDPHCYHNIPSGTTAERPLGVEGQLYYNTTTTTIQRYSGAAWEDLTDSNFLPAGTTMVFCQSTAPVGWTRKSSINDRMLRAVSGATGGATGGAWGITIAAEDFAHTHGPNTSSATPIFNHLAGHFITGTSGSGSFIASGTVSHNESTEHYHGIGPSTFNHGHSISSSWRPKYKDVILAEKN